MTINNQNIEVAYAWDGTAKDFTITFEAIDPVQIKWMYRDGRLDDLNANVIVSDTDPWVLRLEPGSAGDILIYRDTPITQETQYTAYDSFPAEAHEAGAAPGGNRRAAGGPGRDVQLPGAKRAETAGRAQEDLRTGAVGGAAAHLSREAAGRPRLELRLGYPAGIRSAQST